MSTAYSLYKNFIKKGFTKIDSGCYSVIFESKTDPNLVYKLGTNVYDPCLDYLKLGLNNIHFPKIYSLFIADTYYIAKMESLYTLDYTKWSFRDEIEDAVHKAINAPLPETTDLNILANSIANIVNNNDNYRVDLHSGNIMLRNNLTPVVIDPICDDEDSFPEYTLDKWEDAFYEKSMQEDVYA